MLAKIRTNNKKITMTIKNALTISISSSHITTVKTTTEVAADGDEKTPAATTTARPAAIFPIEICMNIKSAQEFNC